MVDGVKLPVSPGIVAENAKTGDAWWVTTPQNAGDIEGYASQVSAVSGDTVALFVSTKAAQFHVEAYRMGYYQGIGGRLVWTSAEMPGIRQGPPALVAPTNTVECRWTPSLPLHRRRHLAARCLSVETGRRHRRTAIRAAVRTRRHLDGRRSSFSRASPPGRPTTDGAATASTTATATGRSPTSMPRLTPRYADRARIVSFDRPYDHDWANGAADFVGNEFPVVYQAERLGLDVTYWTDVDLHTSPQLLNRHKALVSLGHDEYWSTPMRDGATQSLAAGVNLAFLGANACYRQIRFEASPLGPNRHQVCYKSAAEDPMTGHNDALVTVNWPQAPVSRPEAQLIGSTYQDIEAHADMVVTDPTSWVLDGLGMSANQRLPNVVQGEFDRYVPAGAGPTNLDVIAHSIIPNRRDNYSDVTWYTVPAGGGVFATGNASWVGALSDSTLIPPNLIPDATPGVTVPLLQIMMNLYSVIGMGPASLTRPSQGNWRTIYAPGSTSSAAPNTVNAA